MRINRDSRGIRELEITISVLPEDAAILRSQIVTSKTHRAVFPEHGQSLPEGWRWVKLGEVCRFESGGTPAKNDDRFWNGDIPFVTGADITSFYVTAQNARAFLTREGLESGKTAICRPGTVLFVTRTRVGRVGIAKATMGASQDLTPLVCGDEADSEFVCRYLLSIGKHLVDSCRGATIQGLL